MPASNLRAVPCGGLGGCVELGGDSPTIEHELIHKTSEKKIRKKPTSIDLHRPDATPRPRFSPSSKSETGLSITPRTPNDGPILPTPRIAQHDAGIPTPYEMWDACRGNPWLATVPRKETFPPKLVRRQTEPVELAGSLLLPSQGFAQKDPPRTPSIATKPARKESGPTVQSPPPGLTHSGPSTPDALPSLRSAFASPSHKRLLSLPVPELKSPANKLRAFAALNIEQLLQVLPSLNAQDIVETWMLVVEKEFAKVRGFASSLDYTDLAHLAAVHPFCEEIQGMLRQAKVMCEKHTTEFKNAQESTDVNHESDAVKVARIHSNVCDILHSFSEYGQHQMIPIDDFEETKTIILQSIQFSGGFIRNQLTFQLHNLCGGLTEKLIQRLKNFDRKSIPIRQPSKASVDSASVYSTTTRTSAKVSSLDDFSIPTTPAPSISKSSSSTLSVEDTSFLKLDPKEMYPESKDAELQDIIDSYFDLSINRHDSLRDSTVDRLMKYQTRITQLDREASQIRKAFMPPKLQIKCQPTSTPIPTPPIQLQRPSSSSSPALLSPTTPTITPKPISHSHQLTHSHSHSQFVSGLPPKLCASELAARDTAITTLRAQLDALKSQNQSLSGDVKTLTHQLNYLRVRLVNNNPAGDPTAGGKRLLHSREHSGSSSKLSLQGLGLAGFKGRQGRQSVPANVGLSLGSAGKRDGVVITSGTGLKGLEIGDGGHGRNAPIVRRGSKKR